MADARIVIDTKIRKEQALKDLAVLQKDAKSTAAEIARLDQKLAAAKSDTKLADNLRQAQKAAADTAAELERVNTKLETAKQTELAKIKATPGFQNFKPSTLSSMAKTNAMLNNPEAVKQSEALAATLSKQEAAVIAAKAAVDAHAQSTQHMAAAQQVLRERLDGINAAMGAQQIKARAASAMSSFVLGISSFARKAHRAVSRLSDGFKRLTARTKLGGKAVGHFGSRLREIALGALIFNGISKALRGFVTGMNNALTKSGAFTAALSNLKGAALNAAAPLVSALTPALTAIANAAAIALSYIGRLFAFFSGKSIASLKSTAKAMGGVAAGTNAAKKALAGFDTINTLDTSSGSGGGSASPPNLAYEASNPFLDSLTDAIKGGDWAGAGTMLADKLNSIIAGWDAYGWGQKLGGMLQNGISFAFSFFTTFDWNGLGAKLAGFVNGLLNQVDGAQLGALFAAKFTIAIRTLGTFLANLDWAMLGAQISSFAIGFIDALAEAIQSVDWGKIGEGILDMLEAIDWAGLLRSLGGLIEPLLPSLLMGLVIFSGLQLLHMFGAQLLPMLLSGLGSCISTLFTSILPHVVSGIGTLLSTIVAAIGLWPTILLGLVILFIAVIAKWGDQIQAKLQEIDAFLQNIFVTDWSQSFGILGKLLNAFFANVKNIWNSIKLIFDGIIDFIRGVFTGDWERAWKGVKEIFAGIFGALKAIALAPINAIIGILNGLIDSINWVIEKVNGISFTNPFTGNTVGFNFPSIGKIPYLAQGAVIPPNREFMAVLGDQSSGTNIEAPLETIKQALSEVMTQQGGGDITIKFTGDLAQLARVLHPVIEREQHRRGTRLVKGVV